VLRRHVLPALPLSASTPRPTPTKYDNRLPTAMPPPPLPRILVCWPLSTLGRRRCLLPAPSARCYSSAPTGDFQKSQKRSLKDQHHGHKEKRQDAAVVSAASPWEVTCGLEVHAQLNTKRKLFSGEIRRSWRC